MPDINALFKSQFTVPEVTGMYIHTRKMESVGEYFVTAAKITVIKQEMTIMARTLCMNITPTLQKA